MSKLIKLRKGNLEGLVYNAQLVDLILFVGTESIRFIHGGGKPEELKTES